MDTEHYLTGFEAGLGSFSFKKNFHWANVATVAKSTTNFVSSPKNNIVGAINHFKEQNSVVRSVPMTENTEEYFLTLSSKLGLATWCNFQGYFLKDIEGSSSQKDQLEVRYLTLPSSTKKKN